MTLVDEANGGVRQGVHAVPRQLDALVVGPEKNRVVGVGGKFQKVGPEPRLIAAPFSREDGVARAEVPLADIPGVVAPLAEAVRQRRLSLG